MKDKGIPIANVLQEILDESNFKPSKVWLGEGNKFYNRSIKLWVEKIAIEIYSTHNEGKSVVAGRWHIY